jgi:ribosomal protein S18 acetylase RimI-like enzyme
VSELIIRPARLDDAALVAALVAELAEQQGDPTEHISVEAIKRDAFRPSPEFAVLLAETGGSVVGYALFHLSYEPSYAARGVYLCDLYVRAAARRQRIGRALAAAVAGRAKALGRSYVWWVSKPRNETALAFYKSLGVESVAVLAHALTFDTFEALAAEGDTGALPAALPEPHP